MKNQLTTATTGYIVDTFQQHHHIWHVSAVGCPSKAHDCISCMCVVLVHKVQDKFMVRFYNDISDRLQLSFYDKEIKGIKEFCKKRYLLSKAFS